MHGYVINIEKETVQNEDYRRVLYTTKHSQLVVMAIQPGDEIGEETHNLDQFIRFEKGIGRVVIDGVGYEVEDDFAVVIPAGACHNVVNTGADVMKLYSLYMPPEHKHGIVHKLKSDETHEHFDGVVSE